MLCNLGDLFHIFLFGLAIPVIEELAYLELEYWRLEHLPCLVRTLIVGLAYKAFLSCRNRNNSGSPSSPGS